MKKSRILVVGSSNTDRVVRVPRIPTPGETVLRGEFVSVSVGKGANQAVSAAERFANAAAALSVTRIGAQPSAPTRSAIDRFLKHHLASCTKGNLR